MHRNYWWLKFKLGLETEYLNSMYRKSELGLDLNHQNDFGTLVIK